MKRLIVLLSVVFVFSQGSLWAADAPKAEVFAGFSALTQAPPSCGLPLGCRVTMLGWQGSVAGSLGSVISVVGDFGGHYKDGLHAYEYMGGLQVSSRSDKSTVFIHVLGGAASVGGTVAGVKQVTDTALMLGIGGGVDVHVSDTWAVRAIQFDWIPSKPAGWEKNQLRFGFGVVHLSK